MYELMPILVTHVGNEIRPLLVMVVVGSMGVNGLISITDIIEHQFNVD